MYTDIAGFEHVLLEESFVLDVVARPGSVEVTIDLVLLVGHEAYHDPRVGEMRCYVRAALRFSGVTELSWVDQGRRPAIDASGDIDYGGVDLFDQVNNEWRFAGDWGDIRLKAESIGLELTERSGLVCCLPRPTHGGRDQCLVACDRVRPEPGTNPSGPDR